jgi:geranylgeranyl pyrophosphate synthase
VEIAEFAASLPPLVPDLDRVVTVMRRFAPHGDGLLEEALTYYLVEAHGGYARPALVLAAGYAAQLPGPLQPVNDSVVTAAAAIELLNVGTLYHDDVIDRDDLRRGVPSANAKWGDDSAIIAGDYLMVAAIGLALELGLDPGRDLLDTSLAIFRGSMKELENKQSASVGESAYLEAVVGKQAALLACACRLGAQLSGLHAEGVACLETFGFELGIAGQIVDDVVDLTSSSEFMGKPVGSDLRAGTRTLPIIYAMNRSPDLSDLVTAGVDGSTVDDAIRLVVSSGAVELAQQAAQAHIAKATTALRSARLNQQVTGVLTTFAEELLTGACWRE